MPANNIVTEAPASIQMTPPPLTRIQENEVLQGVTEVMKNAIGGIPHPNIDPVALSLGPIELRWYSLAYLAGIILGWLLISRINRKYGGGYITPKALESLPMWIVISVVLGGRLGYVLFYNFEYYLNNISEMLQVWHGGMSFHGGLAGVIIGAFVFARVHKLKYFRVTDLLAIATPIGLFFGRLANFVNKELIGKPVEFLSWRVVYPGDNFGRHPSQIYEALTEGALLFVILYVMAKYFRALERPGLISGMFLAGYGIARAFCEMFREPDTQIGYLWDTISMGQLLCVPMILAGVVIMLLSKPAQK